MKNFAIDIVQRPQFENSIILLIILNAAILGLETVPSLVQRYGNWFLLSIVVLALMGVPIFNHVWEFGQTLLGLIMLF